VGPFEHSLPFKDVEVAANSDLGDLEHPAEL
jgi:hypothetical protein